MSAKTGDPRQDREDLKKLDEYPHVIPRTGYFMPDAVEVWMVYTKTGEMRMQMFQQGGFVDNYMGWTIEWNPLTYMYIVSYEKKRAQEFPRKAMAYKFVRDMERPNQITPQGKKSRAKAARKDAPSAPPA